MGNKWLACSWEEEVAKLVEGDGHDSVCEVEGFLDSVTMVNVYINVQHPRVVPVCECVWGGRRGVEVDMMTCLFHQACC